MRNIIGMKVKTTVIETSTTYNVKHFELDEEVIDGDLIK